MVWFVKGSRGDTRTFVDDTISGEREKSHHEWQQAESEAAYYIERLCSPSGIVWEPFGGGGTTLAACESLGRKWIACEINPASAAQIADRLRERKAA
jgi:site-specific DNA-methyltransferase (adenine-specific)